MTESHGTPLTSSTSWTTIYRDFEIQMRRVDDSERFLATAHLPDEERRAETQFLLPYRPDEVARVVARMEGGYLGDGDVKEVGATLYGAIFSRSVGDVFRASRNQKSLPLRLRLIIDDAQLTRLPWELLYDPERQVFLAMEAPIVRSASFAGAAHPLAATLPLRVLIAQALPNGLPKLETADEVVGIREAFAALTQQNQVVITVLEHATLRALQNALREAIAASPAAAYHVLHFIGHGMVDRSTGDTALLFETEEGDPDAITAEHLAGMLAPYDLRLVFLNACASLQVPALDLAGGLAPRLLEGGVSAVVGMQMGILDEMAIRFSGDFYAALADNRPVDQALLDARQLAVREQDPRLVGLGMPVCYLRTASGQIVDFPHHRTWRQWLDDQLTLRGILRVLGALVAFISAILGIYWGLAGFFTGPPTTPTATPIAVLHGDLNIAVAQFGRVAGDDSVGPEPEPAGLADEVFAELQAEIQPLADQGGFKIEWLAPTQLGVIDGANPAERAENALSKALLHHADILIYGQVRNAEDSSMIEPLLYVASTNLANAQELEGVYPLGDTLATEGDVNANPVVKKEVRGQMAQRADALARFAIGLGYFSLSQYERASIYLAEADKMAEESKLGGREVMLLFLGNTAGQLGDLPLAGHYYQRALEENLNYARALLGVAQIRFLLAKDSCRSGKVNVAAIDEALADYQEALTLLDQSPLAEIPTKAAYGMGQANLCLAQAGAADSWGLARQQLEQVTRQYDDTQNLRIKYLAADAHNLLGLLFAAQGDRAPADEDRRQLYEQATEHYRRALELSRLPNRRAAYALWLANLSLMLGKLEGTTAHCKDAAKYLFQADEFLRSFLEKNPSAPATEYDAFRAEVEQRQQVVCPPP